MARNMDMEMIIGGRPFIGNYVIMDPLVYPHQQGFGILIGIYVYAARGGNSAQLLLTTLIFS